MNKILVTGGRGYVGGRVVRHLLAKDGYSVVIGGRRDPRDGSLFVEMDWSHQDSLLAACRGVDTVLHFAAMNENECVRDPAAALEANGVATIRLLEAAKKSSVQRFLYLSTAHVYGAPLVGEINEDTVARPRHPYATSHRAAEDSVLAAHAYRQIDGMVVRLSNSFGAPVRPDVDRWTLLVNELCLQIVRYHSITLKSTGLQRRDFIPLSDVARGIDHLLDLDWRACGEPIFNLGGAWAPTVYEMAGLVASRCQHVLGFTPVIERPQPEEGETAPELQFHIDKLLATGFALRGDPSAEIDDTLRLCAAMSLPSD